MLLKGYVTLRQQWQWETQAITYYIGEKWELASCSPSKHKLVEPLTIICTAQKIWKKDVQLTEQRCRQATDVDNTMTHHLLDSYKHLK